MTMVGETEELPRVLDEILEAMAADAIFLTIHPEGEIAAEAIGGTAHDLLTPDHLAPLLTGFKIWPARDPGDEYRWFSHVVEGRCYDVLVMPVQRVEGHSRLVLTAWFEGRSAEQLRHAEDVFLRRRPFAVGYFRLWQLDRTLQRRLMALESALNLSDFGVILIERSGKIAFANRAAAQLIESGDGVDTHGGRLTGVDLQSSVHLRVAIDHVVHSIHPDEDYAPLLQLKRRKGPPLIAAVMPVEEKALEASHIAAILYVLDPVLDIGRTLKPLCKLYHLSNVETELASLLASGHSLGDAAAQMRIQEQTARTYLKNIFIKTGAHRQTDLVRLLLSSVIRSSHEMRSIQ